MNHRSVLPVLLITVVLTGCTTYYRVTDPSTGHEYYTTQIKYRQGGTVLHDDKSGREVLIQNSEVEKVTKDQYQAAIRQP